MKTPRPRIHGTQTAIVTGPAGRRSTPTSTAASRCSSTGIATARKREQLLLDPCRSGLGRARFGGWFLPRIGQEVIVAFLEGDPDRPLVVGSVYNAEQTRAVRPAGNATQSGVKTHSSMGGTAANFNELRFEDKKGSELVTFHAEKDLDQESSTTRRTGSGMTKPPRSTMTAPSM